MFLFLFKKVSKGRGRYFFLMSLWSAVHVPRALLYSLELVSRSATENTLQFQPNMKITVPNLPLRFMPSKENLFCLVAKIQKKTYKAEHFSYD